MPVCGKEPTLGESDQDTPGIRAFTREHSVCLNYVQDTAEGSGSWTKVRRAHLPLRKPLPVGCPELLHLTATNVQARSGKGEVTG